MAEPDIWAAFNPQSDSPPPPPPQSMTIGTPKPQTHVLAPTAVTQMGLNPSHVYQQNPTGDVKDLGDNGAGLDPASTDFQAHTYITTGQMPALGMGNSNIRKQILDRAAEIAGAKGLSGEAFATQIAHYKAGTAQVQNLEKQLGAFKQNEGNALLAGQQFLDASKDLPLQTGSPALNSVIQFGQTQIPALPGHDAVAGMNAYWQTFVNEYAKVVAGSPNGSGVLSDSARHEYMNVMRGNYGYGQKIAAFQAMRNDMSNRIIASEKAINDSYAGLSKAPGYSVPANLSDSINAAEGGQQSQPNALPSAAATPPAAPSPSAPGAPPNAPPSPTDPTETTAGAFADQTPYSPAGAQAFHDAFYSAMAGKQLKSVGDVQNWVAQYNKQHNSDWGLDYTNTPKVIAAALSGKQFGVQVPTMTQTEQARLKQRQADPNNQTPRDSFQAGVADSATVGGLSQLMALGDAGQDFLGGKGFDYTGNLNADKALLAGERGNHPGFYVGGQLAGGAALPAGGARTVPEFAKLGAAYGGVYGFNESAGQPLADRGMNALYGAGEGAAVPYALKGAGKVIPGVKAGVNKLLDFLPQKAASDLPINPDQLAAAGQAEGVPVNRMMVDPALETKATAVGKTMIGAPRLRAGMNDVGSKIEGRVQDLGQGGNALEPQPAGNTVIGAAKRYITDTGAQFNRLYGSLQKATQGIKITPAQALLDTEQMIGKLSETPNQNANEINFLQGLKSDLSKGLSIDALRGMRTKLRQNIANGNLTFGADEGRVLSIMDAASQDIGNGLRAAGKGAIADRYTQVDAAYRDRMNMIQGTVQKLIGKRGQNVSGEQVYANLKAMAGPRGDASGLTRMMDQMTPEERNDMAATFADALGKNQAGDFSTAFLAKRVNAMPQAMRVAVFGEDGARSLNNLGMLAKAHARVAAKLGGSPTGLANDYRGWLTDLVLGGGIGLLTESGGKGAAVAAAGAGIKATRDVMNARMLLNTDIQKWLRSAPASTSQKAIDVHFARLNSIAARNPGLAQDIVRLKQSILSAANSNSPISGAAAASPDQGPQQQAQSQ